MGNKKEKGELRPKVKKKHHSHELLTRLWWTTGLYHHVHACDYRLVPPHLCLWLQACTTRLTPVTTSLHHHAHACAGIKPRSSCILGKHPTNCGNGNLKMTFSSFSLNSASTANKVLSGSKGRDFQHFWKVIATLNTGIMLPSACVFLNACLLHIKLFFMISVGIWILSAIEIGVIKKIGKNHRAFLKKFHSCMSLIIF